MFIDSNLKTMKPKFRKYCEHSTLHGVFYLSDGSRWWIRGVWLLILACSLCLCCYLSHMIWEKFNRDPTLTVVETTHYSTADIPFPSVTVCHEEPVYWPNAQTINHLLSLRGYNRTQILDFFGSFSKLNLKVKDFEPRTFEDVKKMHYLLEDLGYPLKKLLTVLMKPCTKLLVECSWRSQPYNCSKMFRHVHTVKGQCCQFDIPYFKSQVGPDTNFVPGIQVTEALDILVDGQMVTSDGKFADSRVALYVMDPGEEITIMNSAVMLTPSAYFDMNVNLWAIDTSSQAKGLALNSRRCIVDSDPGAVSHQVCMARNILKQVVDKCKCLPFDLTAKELHAETYSPCTWDRLFCVYESIKQVQSESRGQRFSNECFQKCDYVQYDTEVEYMKKLRNQQGMGSASSVMVHYSDITCIKYRREVLYTWDQMLANLGGIFGLCLGGSIISVIEIIWFMLDLLLTLINNTFHRKPSKKVGSTRHKPNQVFSLTRNHSDTKRLSKTQVRYEFTN